jgi:hypothetical protein
MVIRRIFRRIWHAMDWLAAAMLAGVSALATMWLEGMIAYSLALHGYVPDPHLGGSGPSADDEQGAPTSPANNCDDLSRD